MVLVFRSQETGWTGLSSMDSSVIRVHSMRTQYVRAGNKSSTLLRMSGDLACPATALLSAASPCHRQTPGTPSDEGKTEDAVRDAECDWRVKFLPTLDGADMLAAFLPAYHPIAGSWKRTCPGIGRSLILPALDRAD